MDCEQFRETIPALLSDGASITTDAARHLAACRACSAEYAAYCHALDSLRSYRPPVPAASLSNALRGIHETTSHPGPFSVFRRGRKGNARPRRRRALLNPGTWHWAAQFVTAMALGGLAGLWWLQSWKPDVPVLPLLSPEVAQAQLTPLPKLWNGTVYDLGTGPEDGWPSLDNDVERTRWKADLGYTRLDDQLHSLFKGLHGVRYYLDPSLSDRRISPLSIKEGIPFSVFLQRLAHASNLTVRVDRNGRAALVRTNGAWMYRRGPIYYFVPRGEGIAPLYTDLYRASQSHH